LAHRGSYKTTCRVISVIWGLLYFPETTILIIRKSNEEAEKIVVEIMRHYEREPLRQLYLTLFGLTEPKSSLNWSKMKGIDLITKTKISKERNVESGGIGKYPTGAHFDLIIADDIVTVEDRHSEAERENSKEFIRELINIKNPGDFGIKFSGTKWHDDDAYNSLITTQENVKIYPATMKFIPELTDERLKKIRENIGESLYYANYLLELIPDTETLFNRPQFEYTPNRPLFAYLDPNATDREAKNLDFAALTIGTVEGENIYIRDGYIWQKPLDIVYDNVEEVLKNYECILLFVESNAAQIAIANEFVNRGFDVRKVKHFKNKHFRVVHHAKKNWKNLWFHPDMDGGSYLKQILSYNLYAKKKDAPDSLAGFCQACTNDIIGDSDVMSEEIVI
jgi:hypothetical protein